MLIGRLFFKLDRKCLAMKSKMKKTELIATLRKRFKPGLTISFYKNVKHRSCAVGCDARDRG